MEFPPAGPPVAEGRVERGGAEVAWQLYGAGEHTILLLPPWSIVHSRHWKFQVPYLSRHARVLVMEGRGNGASSRPSGAAAYADEEYAADALAVMDASGTEQAALVSLSAGARWALLVAAEHPERVTAAVFIAPALSLESAAPFRRPAPPARRFEGRYRTHEGWEKYNAHYFRSNQRDFVEFFFSVVFPEPHSTKPIEDAVGWGMETDAETLVATSVSPRLDPERTRELAGRVRCPVLVIHGAQDGVAPHRQGGRLAEATGGRLLTMDASGHCPHVRDPVAVNLAVTEFILPAASRSRWTRALARPCRALAVSSPIGLGHARRDLAIARELRRLVPGLEIEWLAQHPVTALLEQHGETVHPASRLLASESAHIERESSGHRLHVFEAWRRMDEILLANFMVFRDVVAAEDYDLWIGDEAWEIDHFLFENPELKHAPYVWMTDFVGWLPAPGQGEREARLTADYNAEMIEHVARYPSLRDRAIFIGRPDDLPNDAMGPGLPSIREWTEANYRFSGGYVVEMEPGTEDRAHLRHELGYRDGEVVAVASVGGSGVGAALLARLIEAFPAARRRIPGLRLIAVAGPRVDPASLPEVEGVEVRGFVPDLNRHLAACDLGLVQGGLTTTMELAAYGRPFLYFPLRDHCEQQRHVRFRLDRYRAGRCLDFDTATPDVIAAAMAAALRDRRRSLPVETGSAARVAEIIAELL